MRSSPTRRNRSLGRLGDRRAEGDRRAGDLGPPADPRGPISQEDVGDAFREAAPATSTQLRSSRSRSSSTAATAWPVRWSGRCSTRFRSSRSGPAGSPTEASPAMGRTRCSRRTAASSSSGCARRAPTSGSPGTATPTAASSSTPPASSSRATFSPRCWPSRSCARSRARPSSTTCGPPRRARPGRGRAERPGQPRRTRVLQDAHARHRCRVRRRGVGPLLLPRLLPRRLGTLPALLLLELLSVEGSRLGELLEPLRSKYFISVERSTPRSRTRSGRWTSSPSATRTAR